VHDLLEQELLFLEARALVAEVVGHAVVEGDERVDVRVTRRPEALREVALREEVGAGSNELERGGGRAHEPKAGGERGDECDLHGDEPDAILAQERDGEGRGRQVHGDEVEPEARAYRHALIPYLSSRR
jgi:hypothetical protein